MHRRVPEKALRLRHGIELDAEYSGRTVSRSDLYEDEEQLQRYVPP